MIRPVLIASVIAAAGLAACGPIPVDQAERVCLDNARLAKAPRSTAVIGVGAGGGNVRPYGSLEIDVSSDYIRGRDPAVVYQQCVLRRSGQVPTRALYDMPGWAG
ncbi:hypothetical protein MLD63_04420 [Paracoccus sp. TK19116]|uniref:Lipoprotein n=1 Tax=Paracoccus albicereus TaxID=2922394 RepID=A0ABT1MN27_9RHOB|nr:hypothetical protein [Paracoccus albicereus]MCQ0969672.1 hypothetical protein [Paracoccus albicereus]